MCRRASLSLTSMPSTFKSAIEYKRAGDARAQRCFQDKATWQEVRAAQKCAAAEYRAEQERRRAEAVVLAGASQRRARARSEASARGRQRAKQPPTRTHSQGDPMGCLSAEERVQLASFEARHRALDAEMAARPRPARRAPRVEAVSRPDLFRLDVPEDVQIHKPPLDFHAAAKARSLALKQLVTEPNPHDDDPAPTPRMLKLR